MTSDERRRALLIDTHRAISESAQHTVDSLSNIVEASITYPPGIMLTREEVAALRRLPQDSITKSALFKVIRHACSYPPFHLCGLLDGVTEPEGFPYDDDWLDRSLSPGTDEMLHDEFSGTAPLVDGD